MLYGLINIYGNEKYYSKPRTLIYKATKASVESLILRICVVRVGEVNYAKGKVGAGGGSVDGC